MVKRDLITFMDKEYEADKLLSALHRSTQVNMKIDNLDTDYVIEDPRFVLSKTFILVHEGRNVLIAGPVPTVGEFVDVQRVSKVVLKKALYVVFTPAPREEREIPPTPFYSTTSGNARGRRTRW